MGLTEYGGVSVPNRGVLDGQGEGLTDTELEGNTELDTVELKDGENEVE